MALFDIFGTDAQDAAADAQKSGLEKGYTDLSTYFNKGRDVATTQFNNAAARFAPFLQEGTAGTQAYADATGANGAEGQARARANFQTDPGYQFQLDQGNENVLRNQAKTGQLASGATNIDLLNYGQGQAAQQWNNYVSRLLPFLTSGQSAASGSATVDTGLGNLLNDSYQTQGNAAYNTDTGIGNANANAQLARLGASANGIGGLMQLGKLGAQIMGFAG